LSQEGKEQRVQKVLSRAGICSRRAAEKLITEGRVTVDGRVATLGDKADPSSQSIGVDGIPVEPDGGGYLYLALNKPRGVVSTTTDPWGRSTVLDLIRRELEMDSRMYPVGRLDMESTGLILLTNDGFLANRVLHPSFEVPRKYVVEVEPAPTEDGRTSPATVRVIGRKGSAMVVEVTIHTGRKRQIRRSFEHVGGRVESLCRVGIGSLRLGSLEPGRFRLLDQQEVEELYRSTGLDISRAREVR